MGIQEDKLRFQNKRLKDQEKSLTEQQQQIKKQEKEIEEWIRQQQDPSHNQELYNMQVYKFLKWLFNVSQWDNFTKRVSVYMIIGIGGLFFMENSVLFMLIATLIDLVCQLIKNKWEEFEKEFNL